MGLARTLRTIANSPLAALLKMPSIRQRIIFQLKQRYYSELGVSVPLGKELNCPVLSADSWWSFLEIFIEQEYGFALPLVPDLNRWLDLGCHSGFFSLYVIWQRKLRNINSDFRALLVDGDSRCKASVEAMITTNHLATNLSFAHGLIAAGQGKQEFTERTHMSSSLSNLRHSDLSSGEAHLVDILTADQILSILPPPYDLLKLDLEGAEYYFLKNYGPVLAETRYLLLEWHSWHPGGGGAEQIREMVDELGFEVVAESAEPCAVSCEGSSQQCGLSLFRRQRAT